jgi:ribosomal protein S18 acetylase RimI-like enzyme
MDAIRLEPSDRDAAARVFARSFFDYPLMTHYWPDQERRARYLERYLGWAINYGLRYGGVVTTPELAGIAIWLPPDQTHITTWRYILAGFLPLPVLMGIRHFSTQTMPSEDLMLQVHGEIMPGPHWYLWAVAVDPDRQGLGIGTALMQPGLERADAQRLPCYVETHDEENMAFYLNRGFDLVRCEPVPGSDLRFWCFVRQPCPNDESL